MMQKLTPATIKLNPLENMTARVLLTAIEDYIESDIADEEGKELMRPLTDEIADKLGITER